MKEVVSRQLTGSAHFSVVSDDSNRATGVMVVSNVDRFVINMKCVLDDNDSAVLNVYVINIDVNAKAVTFSATRGGSAVDLTAYTVAQGAKFYHDGVYDGSNYHNFTSLRDALLPAAQGGASTLYGVNKLLYPALQAVAISGSAISATNILDKLFDAFTEVKRLAKKGNPSDILMSYKHFGSCMKIVEVQKGPFKVTPNSEKASIYGWSEIEISSVTNQRLKLVGIQEMDDDIIMFIDWSGITFRSNGFFKKNKTPDGVEYFTKRATSGFKYIVDTCLFGELEIRKVCSCAVVYGIPNY
jgi:hypothetical protein